jgi:hypothetical protein
MTIEGNQSWENGFDDNLQPLGDGNAFKLGGQSLNPTSGGHLVKNNVAWNNKQNGFDENSATLPSTLYNNIAWNNGGYNYSFWANQNTFRNNASLGSVGIAASGSATSNSWTLPVTVSSADFVSMSYTAVPPARNADGSLPTSDFLQLASGSNLIDKGTNVGLPYTGTAPDLGAYEYAAPVMAPSAPPVQTTTTITISNVQVSNTTANSATITWTTDQATSGTVSYSSSGQNGSVSTAAGQLTTSHSVVLSNLSKKTTYKYYVTAVASDGTTTVSATQSFTTKTH